MRAQNPTKGYMALYVHISLLLFQCLPPLPSFQHPIFLLPSSACLLSESLPACSLPVRLDGLSHHVLPQLKGWAQAIHHHKSLVILQEHLCVASSRKLFAEAEMITELIRFEPEICICNRNELEFKRESVFVMSDFLLKFPQICLCNGKNSSGSSILYL